MLSGSYKLGVAFEMRRNGQALAEMPVFLESQAGST